MVFLMKSSNIRGYKVSLYGNYSLGTPFHYKSYKNLFKEYFQYLNNIKETNYIIVRMMKDLSKNFEEFVRLKDAESNLKLIIFSEEPFWDITWGNDIFNFQVKELIEHENHECELQCYQLNHFTTDIFNFKKLPYFITTDDSYFDRYQKMFNRNQNSTIEQLKNKWSQASYKYSFYATRRIGKQFEYKSNDDSIYALSRFRSYLAESLKDTETLKVGKGWNGTEVLRQDLADWHLDKLTQLEQNSFIVSALENTYYKHYISEKMFDAFAVGAVPIYDAGKEHRVFEFIKEGSFINVHGLSVREAAKKISKFRPDKTFFVAYLETQNNLSKLFSNKQILEDERKLIVEKIYKSFNKIKEIKK